MDDPGSKIWDILTAVKNLKVIHLKRKNILRTLVSRAIAGKTDQWVQKADSHDTGSRTDKQILADKQIFISPGECLDGFNETRDREILFDRRFQHHDKIEVFYEDLTRHRAQELNRIQEFLGVDITPLSSGLVRQNPEPLSQLISNYSQLKKFFGDTQWSSFFQ